MIKYLDKLINKLTEKIEFYTEINSLLIELYYCNEPKKYKELINKWVFYLKYLHYKPKLIHFENDKILIKLFLYNYALIENDKITFIKTNVYIKKVDDLKEVKPIIKYEINDKKIIQKILNNFK